MTEALIKVWPGIGPFIAVGGVFILIAAAIAWIFVARAFRTFRLLT
jgi:hypothetical protein